MTRRRANAVVAAWIAFIVGLVVGGDATDLTSMIVGGGTGVVFVGLGYLAAWRCRALSSRLTAHPAQLAMFALGIGAALGLGNLAANWGIAVIHPAIRSVLAERMTTMPLGVAMVSAPLEEEVAVRLFMMSLLAWLASQVTSRSGVAFAFALLASSLVFAVLHIARPVPVDITLASYYRGAVLLKYTLTGLPLGWIFWRWGLPYAILCHAAANTIHIGVQGLLF